MTCKTLHIYSHVQCHVKVWSVDYENSLIRDIELFFKMTVAENDIQRWSEKRPQLLNAVIENELSMHIFR